jgi:HAD superfamily hydrolase (TIGR01509 family)
MALSPSPLQGSAYAVQADTSNGFPTALKALLFDLDGTLVNTDPWHFQAWQAALKSSISLEIDEAFYQARISGKLNPAIVADLLPHLSPSEGLAFAAAKEAAFRALTPQMQPMAGLLALMQWARTQGLAQAVVTNAPPENVAHSLGALGLTTAFSPVVIADLLGVGKPDPGPYLEALRQLGLVPNQAIAFEDSPSGIRSALGAGLYTVGIASTHPPQNLAALGANLVVRDFTDPQLLSLLGV